MINDREYDLWDMMQVLKRGEGHCEVQQTIFAVTSLHGNASREKALYERVFWLPTFANS